MSRFSIILLTLAAFSAAGGQLLFKIGANGREQLQDFINLPIIFGLILYAVGTFLWIYTLSHERLVNVYAFTALTFVLVYIGGIFVIDEKITAAAFGGILLIMAGLYLITNYNA
jgi:drug/metabolite transporter (DMT)-like permease